MVLPLRHFVHKRYAPSDLNRQEEIYQVAISYCYLRNSSALFS